MTKKSTKIGQVGQFNIIQHYGEPQSATTLHEYKVERRESIFISEYATLVPCEHYDDHFVYETDPNIPFISSYMCTCGSAAIVLHPRTSLAKLVCKYYVDHNVHQTGGKRWV